METTVSDITRRAGIDGRSFYRLFADKQDAFMTAHELGLQQVLDVTAGAFFAGRNWPERVWEAGRALTQFLEQNPLVTHVGFVEADAVGPGASQRVQDSYSAFAIFLQEGYLHVPQGQTRPSRATLEVIITSCFELIYQQGERQRAADRGVARAHGVHLSGALPRCRRGRAVHRRAAHGGSEVSEAGVLQSGQVRGVIEALHGVRPKIAGLFPTGPVGSGGRLAKPEAWS